MVRTIFYHSNDYGDVDLFYACINRPDLWFGLNRKKLKSRQESELLYISKIVFGSGNPLYPITFDPFYRITQRFLPLIVGMSLMSLSGLVHELK